MPSPPIRPKSGPAAAPYRRDRLRSCRAACRSARRRAARGSCTCRCRCPACRTRRAPCRPLADRRSRRAEKRDRRPAARADAPAERQTVALSSSRLPACASTSRTCPRRCAGTRPDAATKTASRVLSSTFGSFMQPQLDRIDLQLDAPVRSSPIRARRGPARRPVRASTSASRRCASPCRDVTRRFGVL